MAIETLEDWNTRLGYCGCCEMPSCPTPTMSCQSIDGTASVTGYAPFVQPAGDPEDDLPTIYKTKTAISGDRFTGTGWGYSSGPGTGDISGEEKFTITANWSTVLGETQELVKSSDYNLHNWPTTGDCSGGSTTDIGGNAPEPFDVEYTSTGETTTCEATEWKVSNNYTATGGTEPNLLGCPGPFSSDSKTAWDYQWEEITDGAKLTDEETKAGLRSKAESEVPSSWPTPATGTGCIASYVTSWPTIGDIGEWPDCPDGPPDASATTTLTKSRYRWEIPAEWTGSYFKITWDTVFYPDGWDAMIDDPDYTPPDPLPDPAPPIPQIPDPDAPTPSFVSEDLTYEWTGGDRESAWYELDIPTEEGEVKVVNIRYICYRGPYGSKPQTTGDAWTPPTP